MMIVQYDHLIVLGHDEILLDEMRPLRVRHRFRRECVLGEIAARSAVRNHQLALPRCHAIFANQYPIIDSHYATDEQHRDEQPRSPDWFHFFPSRLKSGHSISFRCLRLVQPAALLISRVESELEWLSEKLQLQSPISECKTLRWSANVPT